MNSDIPITADLLRFNPPDLPAEWLADFMKEKFGITGEMVPLPGERDQNFKVTTPSGERYVLKISASNEDAALVDLQVSAPSNISG